MIFIFLGSRFFLMFVQSTTRRWKHRPSLSYSRHFNKPRSHSPSTEERTQSSCQETRTLRKSQKEIGIPETDLQRGPLRNRWKICRREIGYQQSCQECSLGLSMLAKYLSSFLSFVAFDAYNESTYIQIYDVRIRHKIVSSYFI